MPCNQFPLTQRRKAWGRITILFALIALAITVLPTASFAGTDTAGNVLATDNDANPSGVEGDLYWAGQALNLDDASIDRDIIAAGESLSIRDCTVGGAIRLAARTIDIAKTTVDGSVTVVGQHVVLNSDSTANCFYAIGETVALRGSTKSAALAGDTVTIDGTVEGDVEVWADKLILGKNAHITGTVNAHVSEDPERAAGAEVGALKIDRTENEDTSTVNDVIGGIVAAALSTCFVALLLELVFPRATASAAGMLHQRPMPLWVSGLLGTIAIVPAVLLLIISIAGLSLAGALMCAVIGIALDAWMMVPNWVRGESTPRGMNCGMEIMANNIDHVCQLAGNANHVAIGSDLDGAFGTEQCPYDLVTIADLQKIFPILQYRGFTDDAINRIASGNWIEFLRKHLPE